MILVPAQLGEPNCYSHVEFTSISRNMYEHLVTLCGWSASLKSQRLSSRTAVLLVLIFGIKATQNWQDILNSNFSILYTKNKTYLNITIMVISSIYANIIISSTNQGDRPLSHKLFLNSFVACFWVRVFHILYLKHNTVVFDSIKIFLTNFDV